MRPFFFGGKDEKMEHFYGDWVKLQLSTLLSESQVSRVFEIWIKEGGDPLVIAKREGYLHETEEKASKKDT